VLSTLPSSLNAFNKQCSAALKGYNVPFIPHNAAMPTPQKHKEVGSYDDIFKLCNQHNV
jgi:hypothetical protein